MAPLTFIPCPMCGSVTYFEDESGACECTTCNATGSIEVCEGCDTVPAVLGGYEVCGCIGVELGMAA